MKIDDTVEKSPAPANCTGDSPKADHDVATPYSTNDAAQATAEPVETALLELARLGRTDAFATSYPKPDGTIGYRKCEGELTLDDIRRHRSAHGPHVGAYVMPVGDATRLAIFDLDDHEGTLAQGMMRTAVEDILARLHVMSCEPLAFLSGRGKGMHIWLTWKTPQPAAVVRKVMTSILADLGLEEGSEGGLGASVVEIFPKSATVTDFGSMIALPLGRKSVALSPRTLKPATDWSIRHSPDAETLEKMWMAREALTYLSSDDYSEEWVRFGFALKAEFGDLGFPIWDEWSRRSDAYPTKPDAAWNKWDRDLKVKEQGGVTIASVYHAAEQAGWQGRPANAKAKTRSKDGERQSQTSALLEMVQDAELWHSESGEGYATVREGDVMRNLRIGSTGFRKYLSALMCRTTGKVPNNTALEEVVRTMAGRAEYDSPRHKTWVRVAASPGGNTLYLDPGREDWKVVEITADGWRSGVSDPPVKFRRPQGFLPLPDPLEGDIAALGKLVNVTADDLVLLVCWLIGAFRPGVPLPILWLAGEQGSAKTTALRVCRSLVDPANAAGRGMARTEEDLLVAAHNNWVVSADNLSFVDANMADALCRLATGGGLSRRQHYSNDEEHTIEALRPQLYTGINLCGEGRPDLMDRTVLVKLLTIPDDRRMSEKRFEAIRTKESPAILGALLNGVSMALRRLPEVEAKATSLPRMADFALWMEAAAPAFGWPEGKALATYKEMRSGLQLASADADPVARIIRKFVEAEPEGRFAGTTTLLYNAIVASSLFGDLDRDKGWPKGPVPFGKRLVRILPTLRGVGFTYDSEEKDHVTWHTLTAPRKTDEGEVSVDEIELISLRREMDELHAKMRAKLNGGRPPF